MKQTSEAAKAVIAALGKFKDTPSKTLARKLYNDNPGAFTSETNCYTMVRYYRGARGPRHRMIVKDKSNIRPLENPANFKWKLPPSKAKPWVPFELNYTRTAIMSDIHVPFHDRKAIEAFVKNAKAFKPNAILLNGDICDFYSASRFEKNSSLSSLRDEVESTRQFLGYIRQQFPKSEIIFKEGNHDEWFEKFIFRKAPELYGLPEITLVNLFTAARSNEPEIGGVTWVGDQRVIKAGYLNILHGHELGKGSIAPPVNPARGTFMKTYDISLIGHLHRSSQHTERTLNNQLITCWSTGCFCGLWADYAKVNRWNHGGALLELHGNDFNVTEVRIHNGKVLK